MLIQYVLIAGFAVLLVFFLRHHGSGRTAASVKIAFVLFGLFGVFAVLRPEDVSRLAHWLGVGRGTDLLVYGMAAGFAFFALNTYLRFKEIEGRYVRLARAVALQESRLPQRADHDDPHPE